MLVVFPWLELRRLLYLYQQSRAGTRWLSSHHMRCDNCDIGAGHKAPPQPRRVKPHAVNSLWRPAFNLNQDKYTFTNTCTVHKTFYLNQDVRGSPWFVQQTAIGYSAKSCHQRALQQALPYNSSNRCDAVKRIQLRNRIASTFFVKASLCDLCLFCQNCAWTFQMWLHRQCRCQS